MRRQNGAERGLGGGEQAWDTEKGVMRVVGTSVTHATGAAGA